MNTQIAAKPLPISPLVLADRLITLAQDADRAGFPQSAIQLLGLATLCSTNPSD